MKHKILDLTKLRTETSYVCDECNVILLKFPQADPSLMYKDPYICPSCHMVTDAAFEKLEHSDEIKPVDLSPPKFNMVKEQKGLDTQHLEYDIEPQEEEQLKKQGATIISKRIDVRRDY